MGMLKFFFTLLSITCAGLIIYGFIHVFIIIKRSKAREENERKIFLSKIQQAQSTSGDSFVKTNQVKNDTASQFDNDKTKIKANNNNIDEIINNNNQKTLKDFFSN